MAVKFRISLIIFLLIGIFNICEVEAQEFQKDSRIAEIRPAKPVRIELKRDGKGAYTWELSGSDVNEIIKADVALRKYMKNPDRAVAEGSGQKAR